MDNSILWVAAVSSCLACILSVIVLIVVISKKSKDNSSELKDYINAENRSTRTELTNQIQMMFKNSFDMLSEIQKNNAASNDKRLLELTERISESQHNLQQNVITMMNQINESLKNMSAENQKKLDEMRNVVDEKLQKNLDERLQKSFALVNEQLEKVYSGLGEMKSVATDVGDLKKVLSNVKTRGTLGEYQLGAILEQILVPEQYDCNVATVPGSDNRVEFAIKLPGDGNDKYVYLPIDSKFPADMYHHLVTARENGTKEEIEEAGKQLEARIKGNAKDIATKYINTPYTTDFGIMFLPFEGLYAEVVQRGMIEALQNEYKIMIAGPSTMAAMLNSLQMGFRTLAIKKHSSEVWDALAAVKTEFEKFGTVLQKTQERLNQASSELESLVGTRTRKIQLKLNAISKLGESNDYTGDVDDIVSIIDNYDNVNGLEK